MDSIHFLISFGNSLLLPNVFLSKCHPQSIPLSPSVLIFPMPLLTTYSRFQSPSLLKLFSITPLILLLQFLPVYSTFNRLTNYDGLFRPFVCYYVLTSGMWSTSITPMIRDNGGHDSLWVGSTVGRRQWWRASTVEFQFCFRCWWCTQTHPQSTNDELDEQCYVWKDVSWWRSCALNNYLRQNLCTSTKLGTIDTRLPVKWQFHL